VSRYSLFTVYAQTTDGIGLLKSVLSIELG
jgi:hypothetical protein